MEELLTVSGLSKTFHLSKKQQKLEKTTEKVKVAVDDLSFCTYRGEDNNASHVSNADQTG